MITDNRYFLGIDLGTSGCRATVIGANCQVVTEKRAPMPPSRRGGAGRSEQQAIDWWNATVAAIHQIDTHVRAGIAAVAVDGTSSSLLLCDRDGKPVTPALMYDDRRAETAAAQIDAVAPHDSAARGPGSALAKLIHLHAAVAEDDAIYHALHQADWIAARLHGDFAVSDENNCLKLGYDPVSRSWPAWIYQLGVSGRLLPRVMPVGHAVAQILPEAAETLGLAADVTVVTGTTDSNAATLAAGISQLGEAVTSLGSTLVVKILADRPVCAPRYGVYSHRIGNFWLVGGASNSGGAVLRQFFSDSELNALSAQIDPETSSGLDYYPLVAIGERFPISDPQLTPRLTPRPDDPVLFLHGLLEGIARIEAAGYARLASLGAPKPRRVLTSGGGAGNSTWQHIRQRLLGITVERAAHSEAAYGAALLARSACNAG